MVINKNKVLFSIMLITIYLPFQIKGLNILKIAYAYIFPLTYLLFNINYVISKLVNIKRKRVTVPYYIFLILIVVSAIIPAISKTYDFSYLLTYWKPAVVLMFKSLFLFIFFIKKIDRKCSLINYLDCYIYGFCIYISVSLIASFSPFIRNILMKILILDDIQSFHLRQAKNYTRFGWIGFSGYMLTILCTIGFIYCCICLMMSRNGAERIKYIVLQIFMLIGNMLYGRVGVVASIAAMCILFVFLFTNSKLKYKKIFFNLTMIALVFVVLLYFLKDYNEKFNQWYEWCFQLIISYFETGSIHVSSLESTKLMYWWPSPETLWFGDGRYVDPNNSLRYYQYTDVGVMRQILFFGLPLCLLAYLAVYIFMKKVRVNLTKYFGIESQIAMTIFFMFLAAIIICEYKGEAYYYYICMLSPVLFLSCVRPAKQFAKERNLEVRNEQYE